MARWGQARIEVLASQEHIKHELERGVPIQRIFDELRFRNSVTVSYNSFRLQLKKLSPTRTQTANQNMLSKLKEVHISENQKAPSLEPSNHQPQKFVFQQADDLSFYSSNKSRD